MNILITGGASGLGEAITKRFSKDIKNKVYFTYNGSIVNAGVIEKEFQNAKAFKCNFIDSDDVTLLKNKINELDLDVLINNAYSGAFIKTYFHKIPSSDFLNDFKENIIPTIEITQAAINVFRKKKSGKIITVLTSALANIPPIGAAVYVANKNYLSSLVKVWASENAKFNCTSNSVSPSFMQTDLTSSVDARVVEQMIENHPLKKLLTVDEVAETIYFLAKATSQINGIDLLVNAGTSLK